MRLDVAVHDVIDVTHWDEGSPEPMGKSGKVWLVADDGVTWLFKPVDLQTHRDGTRFAKGTDWSERIACEVAALLGVPSAHVEFARRGDEVGVISRRVHPAWDLAHGNELLDEDAPYTLAAVLDCLDHWDVGAPDAQCEGPSSAAGWFAGFLVLDALIANSDRHQENWGVLIVPGGEPERRLAPSYDHASSLGFQLSETERAERLTTKDRGRTVKAFAERGRSRPFSGKPHLTQLAVEGSQRTQTVQYWADAVGGVDDDALASIVSSVPEGRMSQVARKFVTELLHTNRRRLIDALSGH